MRPSLTADASPERFRNPAVEYFERVRDRFGCASDAVGRVDRDLVVAGSALRLTFAGERLASVLLPGLSPIVRAAGGPVDADVFLWDQASTGVGIPDPPWRLRDVIARGDVRSLSGGPIHAQVDTGSQILTMWDAVGWRGIVWVADAARLPYWVHAAPLRSILHWALTGPGRHLLHAAAVGDERAGALIVGPSGSGKSTTALACLKANLGFVADDYVLAETRPNPRADALYGTAKLSSPSLELLQLAPLGLGAQEPKRAVDVRSLGPGLMRQSAAISLIVLPRLSSGRLAVRRVPAVEALRALAPSTILQHAGESAAGMAVISTLVRRVPAYALELGSEIAAVAPAIRGLLEART